MPQIAIKLMYVPTVSSVYDSMPQKAIKLMYVAIVSSV